MTPHILADEVLMKRRKMIRFQQTNLNSKAINLFLLTKSSLITNQTFIAFRALLMVNYIISVRGVQPLGGVTFGDWPRIEIDSKIYQFSGYWPSKNGFRRIRFGIKNKKWIGAPTLLIV